MRTPLFWGLRPLQFHFLPATPGVRSFLARPGANGFHPFGVLRGARVMLEVRRKLLSRLEGVAL